MGTRKKYLIIIFILSLQIKAQHTLTAAFSPSVGDIDNYFWIDSTGLSLGTSGISQTWNYSTITIPAGSPVSYTYDPMSSVPNNTTFSTGTIAYDDGSGSYNVFENNSLKIEMIGESSSFGSGLFTDPIKFFTLPFQFGSSLVDPYDIGIATGTLTTTGDGTGTLILPSGTYSNILKVKTYEVGTQTLSTASTYTVIESKYYSPISKFPLLRVGIQYTVSSVFPFTAGSFKYGSISSMVATGIESSSTNKKTLGVFPNPVSNGELFVSIPSSEKMTIEIYNVLGQNLKTISIENQNANEPKRIDVRDLAKGMYYLRINSKEITKTQKVIIE